MRKTPDIFYWCAVLVLCAACVCICFYFFRREKRLLRRLKTMLDDSIAGTFTEGDLRDNAVSEIESQMWRFITDNQVASEKLEGQKQKIQSFISDTSHQAITPISNIKIYMELINEQYEVWKKQYAIPDTDMAEKIAVVQMQARKLEFLIDSLTKLSCLEIGVLTLTPQNACISDLLLSMKRQFKKKAEQKSITFIVEPSKEMAVFDMKWTEEALANIVDNAMKYTPAGGTVTVRAVSYQMFLCINVIDSGIGFEEVQAAQIFKRFYRAPAVRQQPGVGIGLSLAREIMEKQKGFIKATSTPGKGSKFSMFLSLKDENTVSGFVKNNEKYQN